MDSFSTCASVAESVSTERALYGDSPSYNMEAVDCMEKSAALPRTELENLQVELEQKMRQAAELHCYQEASEIQSQVNLWRLVFPAIPGVVLCF